MDYLNNLIEGVYCYKDRDRPRVPYRTCGIRKTMAEAAQTSLPDEDMKEKSRVGLRVGPAMLESPPKKNRLVASNQSVDQQLVTVDLLKGLLADTQAAILAAQKANMEDALKGLERRQEQRLEQVEGKLADHGGKIQGMDEAIHAFQQRLEALEIESTDSDYNRGTCWLGNPNNPGLTLLPLRVNCNPMLLKFKTSFVTHVPETRTRRSPFRSAAGMLVVRPLTSYRRPCLDRTQVSQHRWG